MDKQALERIGVGAVQIVQEILTGSQSPLSPAEIVTEASRRDESISGPSVVGAISLLLDTGWIVCVPDTDAGCTAPTFRWVNLLDPVPTQLT